MFQLENGPLDPGVPGKLDLWSQGPWIKVSKGCPDPLPASPCVSLHALRHHRLRRCAARPAALTGWALLAGLPMIRCGCRWWPAQAGHQRRTGERTRFALIRLTYRSQISELALCSFFSSAARGRAPFGAERFFVRGRAPKMTAGTYNKYRKTQLAAAVLEIKEP